MDDDEGLLGRSGLGGERATDEQRQQEDKCREQRGSFHWGGEDWDDGL
jgi:hypothetical protein